MKLITEIPELAFNHEYHRYTFNGVKLPSVTAILRPIDDDAYKNIPQRILQQAAEKGTAVHRAIEYDIKYGVADIEERYKPYFEAYSEWKEKYKPVTLASELLTCHKQLLYAGIVDCVAEIDGKPTIIDFKTTATLDKSRCKLQLEAYSRAVASVQEESGLKFNRSILHLTKDGKYDFVEFGEQDEDDWMTFMAFKKVYDFVKRKDDKK